MTIERVPIVSEKIMAVFYHWRNFYLGNTKLSTEKACQKALDQTLYPGGLNDAGVKEGDLNQETATTIAMTLIEVSESRLREIIGEFTKGGYGDPVEKFNFSDSRTLRIIAAARRCLEKR